MSSFRDLTSPIKTRFAPTPSGFLHIGNAFSFILTWLIARKSEGNILLRIDDLDTGRFREDYLEDIFRSLEWLGLDYDTGPTGPDDFHRRYSQKHRLPLYENALKKLIALPDQPVFACALSRSRIKALSPSGIYPPEGRTQGLSLDAPQTALRIKTPDNQTLRFINPLKGLIEISLPASMQDFVVRKKDGMPAYQLASLVDDDHFGINFIVRGADLIDSTAAQLLLAKKLGIQSFEQAVFLHHSLLKDSDGTKLSKSEGADSLKAMRETTTGPAQIYLRISQWLGLKPVNSLSELVDQIKLEAIKFNS